ncbi:MAG: hypothetical protein JWO08_1175 [Verrucomicrobiaceae bacterium]|nr:hypothetical protein [Verrucomicrobiaceae bacterium]
MKRRTFFERLADWWAGLAWNEPTPQERREAQELMASIRRARK